jgi:farnesyl-diphosphate farnesyltransferase
MNKKLTSSSWDYCCNILQKVSRTFALNITQLEGDVFKIVLVGYLLFRIADTFEDTVYQSEIKKIKNLKDFSEIFKGGKGLTERLELYESLKFRWKEDSDAKNLIENGHIVLQSYFELPEIYREIVDPLIVETSNGMAKFQRLKLESNNQIFQLNDMKELELYCYYVAGVVGIMLTKIFSQIGSIKEKRRELEKFQVRFGIALQLINIIKDYQKDVARGWCYIPLSITGKHNVRLEMIHSLSVEQRQGITKNMLPVIITYLDSSLSYIKLLPLKEKSVRMFCIIPFVLGYNTLHKIAALKGNKISRDEVAAIIHKSNIYSQSNSSLEEDYIQFRQSCVSL